MTQPVLEIENLHLSFPAIKLTCMRLTMYRCILTAEKSLGWLVSPVPVSP